MLVASESSLPKSRRRCGKETNAEKCKMSRSPALVPHRPDAAITAAIFASLPRRSTNMKMGVGSSRKHHHRSGIPHDGRKTGRSRVERPKNHPVWTDWDWRAGGVERVGKTSLRCAVQHVDQTWRGIRGLWFSGKKVLEPNHAHWIKSHIYLSDNVLVAGNTDPLVCAWRSTVRFPWRSISATIASAVTTDGPASMARRIFSFLMRLLSSSYSGKGAFSKRSATFGAV